MIAPAWFRETDDALTLGTDPGQVTLTKLINFETGADLLPTGGAYSLDNRGDGQYLFGAAGVDPAMVGYVQFTLELVDDPTIKYEGLYESPSIVAVAVRDVNNTSPLAGSLGASANGGLAAYEMGRVTAMQLLGNELLALAAVFQVDVTFSGTITGNGTFVLRTNEIVADATSSPNSGRIMLSESGATIGTYDSTGWHPEPIVGSLYKPYLFFRTLNTDGISSGVFTITVWDGMGHVDYKIPYDNTGTDFYVWLGGDGKLIGYGGSGPSSSLHQPVRLPTYPETTGGSGATPQQIWDYGIYSLRRNATIPAKDFLREMQYPVSELISVHDWYDVTATGFIGDGSIAVRGRDVILDEDVVLGTITAAGFTRDPGWPIGTTFSQSQRYVLYLSGGGNTGNEESLVTITGIGPDGRKIAVINYNHLGRNVDLYIKTDGGYTYYDGNAIMPGVTSVQLAPEDVDSIAQQVADEVVPAVGQGVADGVWLAPVPGTYPDGSAGMVMVELQGIVAQFTTAIGQLLAKTYSAGTVSSPFASIEGPVLVMYAKRNYSGNTTVGEKWGSILADPTVKVFFSVKAKGSDLTCLIDAECQLLDPVTGVIGIALTGTQMNIKPGDYFWQLEARTYEDIGTPPVTTLKESWMMEEGRLYVKASFKA